MMEDLNYPNARDCQHGQLRRSCPHCEHDRDMAEANETIQQLQTKLAESEARVGRLEYACYLYRSEFEDMCLSGSCPEAQEIVNETKSQSLQHIEAAAIEKYRNELKQQARTVRNFSNPKDFFEAIPVSALDVELRQQQTNGE